MPIYQLKCDRHKSVVQLMSNDDVPENVTYIQYNDELYKRSETPKADGRPDPYLWEHYEGAAEEGELIVDGKSLISTTDHTTTSAQRRGLNVQAGQDALTSALVDANAAKQAAVAAQIAAETKLSTMEKEIAELKAQLADKE